jgi:hypothetical protein
MSQQLKLPPKGITLKSVTGMSYSVRESIKRVTTGLEVCDFWGFSVNALIGFGVEGESNPRYIVGADYNFKQLPELFEALSIPPQNPLTYLVDLANKLPFVELSGGVGYGCNSDFKEKGLELTATVIRFEW